MTGRQQQYFARVSLAARKVIKLRAVCELRHLDRLGRLKLDRPANDQIQELSGLIGSSHTPLVKTTVLSFADRTR
jgi:hypothetical protein